MAGLLGSVILLHAPPAAAAPRAIEQRGALNVASFRDLSAAALLVSNADSASFEPAIAAIDDQYFIAWNDNATRPAAIYLRSLMTPSRELSPIQRVSEPDEDAYEPSLAVAGDHLVVAYYKRTHGQTDSKLSLTLKLYDRRLHLLDAMSHAHEQCHVRIPQLVAHRQRAVVSWVQDRCLDGSADTIQVAPLDIVQDKFAGPLTTKRSLGLSGVDTRRLWNLHGTLTGNTLSLAFEQLESGRSVAWLATCDLTGTHCSIAKFDQRSIAGDAVFPDVSTPSFGTLLAWQYKEPGANRSRIQLLKLEDRNHAFPSLSLFQLASTGRHAQAVSLAHFGKNPVVSWCDDSTGTLNVYAAVLNLDEGSQATYQLTRHSTYACVPDIVRRKDCLGVVWNDSRRTGTPNDVRQSDIYLVELCERDGLVRAR